MNITFGHGVGIVPFGGQHGCYPITVVRGQLWTAQITSCPDKSKSSATEQILAVHGRQRTPVISPSSMLSPKRQQHPPIHNVYRRRSTPIICNFKNKNRRKKEIPAITSVYLEKVFANRNVTNTSCFGLVILQITLQKVILHFIAILRFFFSLVWSSRQTIRRNSIYMAEKWDFKYLICDDVPSH